MAGTKTRTTDTTPLAPIQRSPSPRRTPKEDIEVENKLNVIVEQQSKSEPLDLKKYEKGTARG